MRSRAGPPYAPLALPGPALLSEGLLETCGPVRHDPEPELGIHDRFIPDRHELVAAARDVVRAGIVLPAAARLERSREENPRCSRRRRRSDPELHREEALLVAERRSLGRPASRRVRSRRPARSSASRRRRERSGRRPRSGPSRRRRTPPTAPSGENGGRALARWTLEPRARRARPVERNDPDVGRPPPPRSAPVGVVRDGVEEVPAVRRDGVREFRVLAARRRAAGSSRCRRPPAWPRAGLPTSDARRRSRDRPATRRARRSAPAPSVSGDRTPRSRSKTWSLLDMPTHLLQHDPAAVGREGRVVLVARSERAGPFPGRRGRGERRTKFLSPMRGAGDENERPVRA